MPIEISGTTVIDDNRNVTDVENVGDANTVYYGSGANLTGIQVGSSTFTASGAISNGDPVIVNSNGTVSAVSSGNASNDNFIGLAAEAISNGSSGLITMVTGINASQSGLTAGQQYYVQQDGSLSTTADSPSLLAGTAISSTQIIVKK